MPPPPITVDLRRDRDFGEVFNATFAFIRQNIAVLAKGVLFFVTPAIVVAQVFAGKYTSQFFSFPGTEPDFDTLVSSAPALLLGMLFSILAWLAHQVVVLGTVRLHEQRGPGQFEPIDAFKEGLRFIVPLVGTSLLMGAFFVVTIPLHILLCIGTVGVAYMAIRLSLASYAVVMDDLTVLDAFRTSWRLVKDDWWQTFGVLLVMGLLAGILSYLFQMPMIIYTALMTLSDPEGSTLATGIPLWMQAIGVLGQIAQYLLYVLPVVAGALQYGNLSEARNQTAFVERMRAFGAGDAAEPGVA